AVSGRMVRERSVIARARLAFVGAPVHQPSGGRYSGRRSAAKYSIQSKSRPAHKCSEIGTQRLGVLPRLFLPPSVERCMAPALGVGLARIWTLLGAAPVVGIDLPGKLSRPVAILVQRHVQWETRRDSSGLYRPPHAQTSDRDDTRRQFEQIAYR